MRRTYGVALILLLGSPIACQRPDYTRAEAVRYRYLPADLGVLRRPDWWIKFLKPDLVPVNVRICRIPEGQYMRWDVLITLQNQGGELGLTVSEAPVDVYVDFDPNRPYGYDASTGEAKTLADHPDLLRDMPEQQWMTVPEAGAFGGSSFSLWYPDGGAGSPYRRIPTQFTFMLDQFRGGPPGPVDESNEGNNGVIVVIDRYDEINGATGRPLIGCWYS